MEPDSYRCNPFGRSFYKLCLESVRQDTGFYPWKRALEYWMDMLDTAPDESTRQSIQRMIDNMK